MGFFDIFRKSVKKTKQSLSLELDSFSGKITFDTLEELEEILILADVGVTTAGKICSRLGERIKRRNIDSTELRENLCEIVTELMEPDEPLVTETKPSVVLVGGVNGVGKTAGDALGLVHLGDVVGADRIACGRAKAKRCCWARRIPSGRRPVSSWASGRNG